MNECVDGENVRTITIIVTITIRMVRTRRTAGFRPELRYLVGLGCWYGGEEGFVLFLFFCFVLCMFVCLLCV